MSSDCRIEIQKLRIQVAALQELLEVHEQAVFEQSAKLERNNLELEAEINERKRAEGELELANQDLLNTSRIVGMAEIATNVLHNVGNVLNSVNVSACLVVESIEQTKTINLAKAVAMLREHEGDIGTFIGGDPKGQKVLGYLEGFSQNLILSHQQIVTELDCLQKNIEHIKSIVSMQQSYAKLGGEKELINIADLVEDSLRLNEGAMHRHHIEIVREFQNVPKDYFYKHKILQILVNLLRNAKYACDDSGGSEKRIIIRITSGDGKIQIAVIDNGVGILPNSLARLFTFGFTTRKNGHGFGLYGAAMAAKEMGGCLTAQSKGLNQGAVFTLELPARTEISPSEDDFSENGSSAVGH